MLAYLSILLLVFGSELLWAQTPRLEWARTKNQEVQGAEEPADAHALPGGGFVVTGVVRTGSDAAIKTLAVDAQGDVVWTALYQIDGGDAQGREVIVADDGSVFVCGSWREGPFLLLDQPSPFNNPRFLLLKYSSSGDLLFEVRSDQIGTATELAYDAGSGDVAIAGRCPVGSCAQNIVAMRYSSDGDLRWEREYDGPRGIVDHVGDIGFSADSHLILVGTVDEDIEDEELTPFTSILVLAYGFSGETLWSSLIPGPHYSFGSDLLIAGDIGYVAGSTRDEERNGFYVTAAYDLRSEEQLWHDVRPSTDRDDVARDMILTSGGDLVVSGRTQTISYSPEGEWRWSSTHEYRGRPTLARGVDGAVFVGGGMEQNGTMHVVEKLSASGRREWLRDDAEDADQETWLAALVADEVGGGVTSISSSRWASPAEERPLSGFLIRHFTEAGNVDRSTLSSDRINSSHDVGFEVGLAQDGSAVIRADLGEEYAAVRYSRDGVESSTARLEALFPSGESHGLAVLPDDSVVLTGVRRGDMSTLAFDADGALLWRVELDTGGYDLGRDLAVGRDARVYAAARPQGDESALTIAWSAAGEELWSASEPTGGSTLGATAIAVSSDERIAVVGSLRTLAGQPARRVDGLLVLLYDEDGGQVWRREIPGSREVIFRGTHVAFGPDGAVYALGKRVTGSTPAEVMLLRYSATGEEEWRYTTNGEAPRGLSVTPDAEHIVIGYSRASESGDLDMAVGRIRVDGEHDWTTGFGGVGEDRLGGLTLGLSGEVYATGSVARGVGGGTVLAVLQITPDGEVLWEDSYTDEDGLDSHGEALAVNPQGHLFVTGSSGYDMLTLCYSTVSGVFRRGDCDGDGERVDLTDAVWLLSYNFLGGEAPPCPAACDVDGDGRIEGAVSDAVYLLQFLFGGGPMPLEPSRACGVSDLPSDRELGCGESGC